MLYVKSHRKILDLFLFRSNDRALCSDDEVEGFFRNEIMVLQLQIFSNENIGFLDDGLKFIWLSQDPVCF